MKKFTSGLAIIAVIMTASAPLPAMALQKLEEPWRDRAHEKRQKKIAKEARIFIEERQSCGNPRISKGYKNASRNGDDEKRIALMRERQKNLCKGTEAGIRALKKKYRHDRLTMSALYDFEDCIDYEATCKYD